MISTQRSKINKYIENLIGPISKNWNPNVITIICLSFSLITCFLYAKGWFLLGALSLSLYAFDLIDGTVARIHGKTSKFGGVLDATCDRVSDGLIFLGFALSTHMRIDLVIIALIGTFMVSYSKAKAEAALSITQLGTNSLSIGVGERGERLILIFIVTFAYHFFTKTLFGLNILDYGMIVLIVLTFITVVMRLRKAYELLKS